MTTTTAKPDLAPDDTDRTGLSTPRTAWWRRPWVLPLAVVCLTFIVISVPRYLTFDKSQSLIPQPGNLTWHYPLLVAHVLFGTTAMVTCCLQVWPWLRRRYPAVHRWSGRLYVFAGVLPSGVLAGTIGAVSPSGMSARLSDVILATLWIACTLTGLRMILQGRQADHRRWMVRSFALTMSIVVSRVLGQIYRHTFLPMPTNGNIADLTVWGQTLAGMASWPGWILPLLVAEYWLVERGAGEKHRRRQARITAARQS